MQFTTSTLAAVLAFTSYVAATPVQARDDALKDWQVNTVTIGTPSGRPGSYPWSTLSASITDPNQINLGPAKDDGSAVTVPAGSQGLNCLAKYFSPGENPLGRTWPCDPSSDSKGYWTMEVLAGSTGSYSSTDFKLKFKHVADVLYHGSEYKASFEAQGSFKVGDNLKGTCGGSGVCSWGLPAEKSPFAIKPTKL